MPDHEQQLKKHHMTWMVIRVKWNVNTEINMFQNGLLREGTFFIGVGGVGRGILEFFCEKNRGPPTS